MSLLEVQDLRHAFGGLVALDDVHFRVEPGRIQAIIGPNGAGKTTLFNVIAGLLPLQRGAIRLDGRSIGGQPPHRIARRGVSRTFQTPTLFLRMTVLENVMIGRHVRTRSGFAAAMLRLPRQRAEEARSQTAAREHLEHVGLGARADALVGSLSFGQRRMVELARALATEPRLLLLDEPASGLNPRETDGLAALIRRIRDRGVTVLLVEHDMSLVMEVADDILVLHMGTPIASGPPAAVRNDPKVVAVYLGGRFAHADR